MTAAKALGEVIDHFAKTGTHPGDWWAPTEDGSELCLEHEGHGVKFWLDINRDGTIELLWKPSAGAPVQTFKFAALPAADGSSK